MPNSEHLTAKTNDDLPAMGRAIVYEMTRRRYAHPFTWLGRPIIQLPYDILAMQEIIWRVKPDLIVETGIAHGGSIVFYASMLELLGGTGRVLGIDIDIRDHNRIEIDRHPLRKRIEMIQGSSIDPSIISQVHERASGCASVVVALDSNHTREHVFQELKAYSPMVRAGGYVVVFDTAVEHMPKDFFPDRPWGPGDNPMTAVDDFLALNDRFVIDNEIEQKLVMTVSPRGYLRCIKD